MTEDRFVRERAASWVRLENLVTRAQRGGLRSLSGPEVRRLAALYRSATADLAVARSTGASDAVVRRVNRLCAAAHDVVYAQTQRGGILRRLGPFLAGGFPALVRRTWKFTAFAAAVFVVAGVAAYVAFRNDPDLAERTLGTVFADRAERAKSMEGDARRYLEVPSMFLPFMSFGIIANNVWVTMWGFAFGALFCVGGVWVLVANGISLGGGFAVFHDAGVPEVLWTFVAAHGAIELTSIFIATGAGLRLGLALLAPGRRTRAAAFEETGRDAVRALFGTAFMLVVAGLLEGFVSPTAIASPVKWAIGGASILLIAWYFARGGRRVDGPRRDPA